MATLEKYLSLVNKAIENLRDNEPYGKTPIEYMRSTCIKSTDNMSIFLDSVGAYLEEIRCSLLADIESQQAKANGKSSILSNVKKFNKICATKNRNTRPKLGYANYNDNTKKYFMTDGCMLLVADSCEGMDLIPDTIKKQPSVSEFDYTKYIPDLSQYKKYELPIVSKIATYRKNAKSNALRFDKTYDHLHFPEFSLKGEYLEMAMRITGSNSIFYKDYMHSMYMIGNGYEIVVMPVQSKSPAEGREITNFDI